MIYLALFCRFFYIGTFLMGGGMAIIPFLQELTDTYPVIRASDVANIVALAEMTPGAVGVNMATYTGFVLAGIPAAVAATLGVVAPSVLIVGLLSRVLPRLKKHPMTESVFAGVKAAVAGLMVGVFGSFLLLVFTKEDVVAFDMRVLAVFLGCLGVSLTLKLNPVVYILGAGFVGALLGL